VRDAYHDDLDAISTALIEMAHLVGSAISRATTALLDADLALAESVITADETVDLLYRDTEERAFTILATQAPVADELRVVVTSLRMVAELERMGDNALNIAKIVRRRAPASAIPPELRATFVEMGNEAEEIIARTASVIMTRSLQEAADLEKEDDVMDALHRRLFTVLLDDRWTHGVEAAIDVTLAGRCYERFADHAISVGRRVVYLVTGERPTKV
jgi:phosphate transport system protein